MGNTLETVCPKCGVEGESRVHRTEKPRFYDERLKTIGIIPKEAFFRKRDRKCRSCNYVFVTTEISSENIDDMLENTINIISNKDFMLEESLEILCEGSPSHNRVQALGVLLLCSNVFFPTDADARYDFCISARGFLSDARPSEISYILEAGREAIDQLDEASAAYLLEEFRIKSIVDVSRVENLGDVSRSAIFNNLLTSGASKKLAPVFRLIKNKEK